MAGKAIRNLLVAGAVVAVGVLAFLTRHATSALLPDGTVTLAADVAAGKDLWHGRNCSGCHTIFGSGVSYAPDLTSILGRRDPVWLARWLADPHAINPVTRMPDLGLAAADVNGLVAFFRWLDEVNGGEWPEPDPVGVDSASGALVFQQKGCSACHRIAGKGNAAPGPDLSRIGRTPYDGLLNTPEFLDRWLDNPQAQKPGTLMPRLPLTPAERDALVTFLTSLK